MGRGGLAQIKAGTAAGWPKKVVVVSLGKLVNSSIALPTCAVPNLGFRLCQTTAVGHILNGSADEFACQPSAVIYPTTAASYHHLKKGISTSL